MGEARQLVLENRQHEEGVIAWPIDVIEFVLLGEHVVLEEPQLVGSQQLGVLGCQGACLHNNEAVGV